MSALLFDVWIVRMLSMCSSELLTDKGQIFVVPSQLYDVVNNEIELSDVATQLVEDCVMNMSRNDQLLSDVESAD